MKKGESIVKLKSSQRSAFIAFLVRAAVIIPVMYVILYPLFTMVSTSLQSQYQALDPSVVWIPKLITDENYKKAMLALDFSHSFLRSIEVNVLSAIIEVATCAVTAYGFARFKFKFKGLLMGLLILSIIVPQEMIAVPTYLQLRYADILGILGFLGKLIGTELRPSLINTPWSFWIPSILSVGLRSGLFIFIYMQFYKGLPKELEEAAYIDGAGPFKTFLKIIVPSSGTAIVTVTIFSVIWHWNEYYLSSIYFSSNFPLAVKLATIEETMNVMALVNSVTNRNGIIMAASLMFFLPMLVMYMIVQRKFVKSVDSVGIVG